MSLKSLSITMALFLLLGQAFGQQQKVSLFKTLQNSKPDTSRLKVLYDIGNYYLSRNHTNKKADLDSAEQHFIKAYKLNETIHVASKYDKYETLCKLGEVYIAQNNLKESRACFMQAANFYHDHKNQEKEALTYRRYVIESWPVSDEFEDMRMLLLRSLAIYQHLNKTTEIVFTSYWIALIDLYIDNFSNYSTIENRCFQLINKYQGSNALNFDYVYNLLSKVNRYKGDLTNALSYSLKSVQFMQMTKDSVAAEQIYGELGQIYQDLDQTEKSIYYYKKTIELREKKDMPQEYLFRTAGFVAQGLIKLNRPAEALAYIEALEKRHKPESPAKFAFIEQVKAYCYEALKDYKKAEIAYLGMIRDYQKGNTEIWHRAEYDVARYYILQKEFGKAALYLQDLKTTVNFSKAKDLELIFFEIDSARGKFITAIEHFRKYKIMNDSIFNVAKSKQIQELQIKYETDQRKNEIKLLRKDSLIQQNNFQRAKIQRNLTLGGIVVLVLLVVFLYKTYSANQQKNIVLNQLIADKDNLLLEKDNLLVEKEWLLKEIHHRVKNNLQIVMGLLQRQAAYIDSELALSAIQNSENRMHSIALIHQKLYQADSLDLIYMPEYIEEFIDHLKHTCDLGNRVIFEKQLDGIYLHVSQAVPLGLILNEAVTNAIKYAYPGDETGVIQVFLSRVTNEKYCLSIHDHGQGLHSGFTVEKADTMGMNLMRGLSKQLSGTFDLQNKEGVTISVLFKMVPHDDQKDQYGAPHVIN